MLKTKEGTFYIVVNPFTHCYTITIYDADTECTYEIDEFYEEIDEWKEIEIAGKLYDIHVLYDEDFWIYVSEVEDGVAMGCGKSREVNLEVQLHDGGPTTKLKRKQY
jgi:hypothetical protein